MPVTKAKRQLSDLVRRAEAGEEIILTRRGHATVRLVPVKVDAPATEADRLKLIRRVQKSTALKVTPGPSAARSQDFLYGDDGLAQ